MSPDADQTPLLTDIVEGRREYLADAPVGIVHLSRRDNPRRQFFTLSDDFSRLKRHMLQVGLDPDGQGVIQIIADAFGPQFGKTLVELKPFLPIPPVP